MQIFNVIRFMLPAVVALVFFAGTCHASNDPGVTITLKSVDFKGTGNHTLKKDGDDSWTNDEEFGADGSKTIDYPEWEDADSDGSGGKNEPVCYTKGSNPEMDAELEVTLNNGATISSASLIVKLGETVLIDGLDIKRFMSSGDIDGLSWGDNTPSETIANKTCTLTWQVSVNGGSYTTVGTTTTRFFMVFDTPKQKNSMDSDNILTCKRINEILNTAGATADIGTIAENIQAWRDEAVKDRTGAISEWSGAKLWELVDGTESGMCAEGSLLMEQAVRLLGIDAEWQHVHPAVSLPVPVHSVASPASQPTRQHCGTTETLYFVFAGDPEEDDFAGWNEGEGCCLVDGKLYSAFAGGIIGETGGVVNGRVSASAAHHILLQLDDANTNLQRWLKADDYPCDSNTQDVQPVP